MTIQVAKISGRFDSIDNEGNIYWYVPYMERVKKIPSDLIMNKFGPDESAINAKEIYVPANYGKKICSCIIININI